MSVREFAYDELVQITDDFSASKLIGEGGFAFVYKAEIGNEKLAIKKMRTTASKEFKAELEVLSCLRHENIVQLKGWCQADHGLFLVYEFVENETLHHHLMEPKGGTHLSWLSRLKIAHDSALGLKYIYEHPISSYVHCDIKPKNILLDNCLRAKVGDFGLARLAEITEISRSAGTEGYKAPEYKKGVISSKVDVFAFGVVLMQLVSAKPARDRDSRTLLSSFFASFKSDSTAKEKLSEVVDPTLKEIVLTDEKTSDSVWKVIVLACECTVEKPEDRPNMTQVRSRLATLVTTAEDTANGSHN